MAKNDLDTVDLGEEKERKEHKIVFESETFFSLAKRKCKTFFTNITLEPVMLFYGIVGWVHLYCQVLANLKWRPLPERRRWKMDMKCWCRSIDKVASSQLILDKTCLNDFGFSPQICSDLQHHNANNTVVQVWIFIPYMLMLFYGWMVMNERVSAERSCPIWRLREHRRSPLSNHLFSLPRIMERLLWPQVAPILLLPHQVAHPGNISTLTCNCILFEYYARNPCLEW